MKRTLLLPALLLLFAGFAVGAVHLGWNVYEFKKADVEVKLPGEEYEEEKEKRENGKTYTVTTTAEGIVFKASVFEMKRRVVKDLEEDEFRAKLYETVINNFEADPSITVEEVRDVEADGIAGKEADVKYENGTYGYVRVLYKDRRSVTLVMMRNGEYPNNFYADVFFESVRFLD